MKGIAKIILVAGEAVIDIAVIDWSYRGQFVLKAYIFPFHMHRSDFALHVYVLRWNDEREGDAVCPGIVGHMLQLIAKISWIHDALVVLGREMDLRLPERIPAFLWTEICLMVEYSVADIIDASLEDIRIEEVERRIL